MVLLPKLAGWFNISHRSANMAVYLEVKPVARLCHLDTFTLTGVAGR